MYVLMYLGTAGCPLKLSGGGNCHRFMHLCRMQVIPVAGGSTLMLLGVVLGEYVVHAVCQVQGAVPAVLAKESCSPPLERLSSKRMDHFGHLI